MLEPGGTLEDLRSGVREWCASHVPPGWREEQRAVSHDQLVEFLRWWGGELRGSGLLAPHWPKEWGGGFSVEEQVVIAEELARGDAPRNALFHVAVFNVAPTLFHSATAEQRARFLPGIRDGEVWCQGYSEPDAGSDLASLRTRAVLDGDHFVVTGQKVWTSWAQYADRCILLARTGTQEEGHRGITALFVDMRSPGLTVRPLRAMSGDAEFAELFFDDVAVPKDRTLGAVGAGWALTMYVLSCERGAVAWQRQAWMHRRLGDLIAQSPADVPASWAGETFALLYALRLASRRTLRRLADGEIPGPDASVDKVLMASAEQLLFDGALDHLPATLVAGDDPAARTWRTEYFYSRAASIYGGTSEIQRNILAERVLGLPRS